MTALMIVFMLFVVFFSLRMSALWNIRLTKTLELCEGLAEQNKRLSQELTMLNAANTMMNMKINRLEDKQVEREEFYAQECCKEA